MNISFSQALANETIMGRAALAVANHGFADAEFGSVDEDAQNNVLVRLNHVTLRNLGEDTHADAVRSIGEQTFEVWVLTMPDGSFMARFAPEDESEVGTQFEAMQRVFDRD